MIGQCLAPLHLLGSALALGIAMAGPLLPTAVLAQPALAQTVAPAQAVSPEADSAVRENPAPPSSTDCRGGETGRPSCSNTIIMTPDGKTTVPRTVIREQADFRLNEALRNVPGVSRR